MGKPGAVVEKFLVPLQDLQEKDPLSYGSYRAAGGGAERSWGAGEVLERSLVNVEASRSMNNLLNTGGLYIPGRFW